MSMNTDDMPETTVGSPKTTNDSPSSTPRIPSPVYRAMHSVEMTFVADDESSEAAAAKPSTCCSCDVDKDLCITTSYAESAQPSFLFLNAAPIGRHMHSLEINYIHSDAQGATAKHPMGDKRSALDAVDTGDDDDCTEQGKRGDIKGAGSAGQKFEEAAREERKFASHFAVPAEENANTLLDRVGVAEMPEPVIKVQQTSQLDEMALFNLLRAHTQDLLPECPIPSERLADMQAMISRLPRLKSRDEQHERQQNFARTRPKTRDEFLLDARLRQPPRRERLVKSQSEY